MLFRVDVCRASEVAENCCSLCRLPDQWTTRHRTAAFSLSEDVSADDHSHDLVGALEDLVDP